eukprot:CAMPEP_0198687112 /NCGR_PEP_ID=MMETSP1468-20131203/43167_1 /TAXON_ID=1461545 /ORGANISM="Mantoniella sp, Strain CCMP1436" /LENGTH=49 /DNA_ID=CAMNT_0044434395 /DNA_START=204 /DNA_END=353 /DNA_ORIENTATION=-
MARAAIVRPMTDAACLSARLVSASRITFSLVLAAARIWPSVLRSTWAYT